MKIYNVILIRIKKEQKKIELTAIHSIQLATGAIRATKHSTREQRATQLYMYMSCVYCVDVV